MKKSIIILFFICFSSLLFCNEKIADFKFKLHGPLDQRVYPVDHLGHKTFGYYSIRPFVSLEERQYLLHGSAVGTKSIQDKTLPAYQNKVDYQDLLNLNRTHYRLITEVTLTALFGSFSILSIIPGIVLLGIAGHYYQYVDKNEGTITDINDGLEYKPFDYYYLRIYPTNVPVGSALLSVGSALLISSLITLGMALFHRTVMKDLKTSLIKGLNNDNQLSINKKIKVKFDCQLLLMG